jgi:hypothetical protein
MIDIEQHVQNAQWSPSNDSGGQLQQKDARAESLAPKAPHKLQRRIEDWFPN